MAHRDALTIRFPSDILERARRVKTARESFNEFVVGAVDREARRRAALKTLDEIDELRERIAKRTGIQPDSVPLIRELREERLRRFDSPRRG